MKVQYRAFALIWIIASMLFACWVIFQYGKLTTINTLTMQNITNQIAPINDEKLLLFVFIISFISVIMGLFFYAYSNDLDIYLSNYHRKKSI